MANVSVIGLGYIGLPTAAVLGSHGHKVFGCDVNQETVDIINSGRAHVIEPDLDAAVESAVSSGAFKAFTTPQAADVYVIVVPTPFKGEEGGVPQPDMSYVESAANAISSLVKEDDLIILESTSPVGATRANVADVIEAARPELKDKLHYCYCPERVLPGQILTELIENDRVVGGLTPEAAVKAKAFYKTFVKGAVFETVAEQAELVKLTENTYRDINIAFANELSAICDEKGLNVWEVIQFANRHPRVNVHFPGPGVGGHCIAVDPWFIVSGAPETAKLTHLARNINDAKPAYVVEQILKGIEQTGTDTVALLGMAYKPDVDDLRESPSVEIAHLLKQKTDAKILIVEPYVDSMDGFDVVDTQAALKEAGVVAMLTNHKEFMGITLAELDGKAIVDTRGVWA
ncbi:MAG: UDP-N-acetyl-D-mannosamine dehydrogenase [Pseudomonadota bacterium]|nr:UDP-N-acetyl-D-mannosamine dehydrogenase [Pseudomonadota bacterium]